MEARAWIARLLLGAGVLVSAAGSLWADDPLRDVKELYATAAYEETLAALARLDDPTIIDQVDEYRALCLIALHRDAEAERAVERLVRRHPLPLVELDDRSPKFVALYHAVRRRLLPEVASDSYKVAKTNFEARDYSTAVRQFGEVLALLHNAEDTGALRDLELLAQEFLSLAEERIPPVVLQPVPEPAVIVVSPAPPPLVSQPFAPVPRVYDSADLEVTPPVVLDQTLPSWHPPWPHVARRTYMGRLQIVVGEDGRVTSADILQSSFGTYDGLLLSAVKQWRYRPALNRGQPVQYRRIIGYELKGSDPGSAQR